MPHCGMAPKLGHYPPDGLPRLKIVTDRFCLDQIEQHLDLRARLPPVPPSLFRL